MGRIFLTMSPLIFSGVSNMIFTKTPLYKKLRYPIDGNKILWDGREVFGKNKTWIGFLSMIIFSIIFQFISGFICNTFEIEQYNDLYRCNENTVLLNLVFGFWVGFSYMLFELPNSFIKRRIGITSGGHKKGLLGVLFFLIDQIDSMLGVMLILALYTDIGLIGYLKYVTVGMVMHVIVNLILMSFKVRKSL